MKKYYILFSLLMLLFYGCFMNNLKNRPAIIDEIRQLDSSYDLLGLSDSYYAAKDGCYWKVFDIENNNIIWHSSKFTDTNKILLNDLFFIFTVNRQHPLLNPYKSENEILAFFFKPRDIKRLTNQFTIKNKLSLNDMKLIWVENDDLHLYDLNNFEETVIDIDRDKKIGVYALPDINNYQAFWVEEQKINDSVIMSIKLFDMKTMLTKSIVEEPHLIYNFDVNDNYVVWTQTHYDTVYLGNQKDDFTSNFEICIYAYDRSKDKKWLLYKSPDGSYEIQITNHFAIWTISGACDAAKPFNSGLYIYDLRLKRTYQINSYVEQQFWVKNNKILVKGILNGCTPINEIYFLQSN